MREYGTYTETEASKRTVLKQSKPHFNRVQKLVHKTEGFEPAGSCARFTKEAYGVLCDFQGATYGQWFKSLPEAEAYFEKHTKEYVNQPA